MPTCLPCLVDLGDKEPVIAEVVDLTIQGAQVLVTRKPFPELELHESIGLTIEGRAGWQVVIRASVRHQRTDHLGTHVSLEFQDLGTLYRQFENVLGRFFNRRRSKRYSTVGEGSFTARLKQGCVVETARVCDLSTGGAAVLLRSFGAFSSGSTVELRLMLPGTRRELVGDAIVRCRHPENGMERMGLEFDLESADGFARNRAAIECYVEKLQRKLEKFLRRRVA